MKHHVERAKHVYADRGLTDLIRTAVTYAPIELNNAIFRLRYGDGIHVVDEDWDNLILLDACRYDMFADRITLDGELQSRISLGSTSEEFLERNFADRTFYDIVYVNTNPYLSRLGLDDGTFHAVIDLLEEWDSELGTIHPQAVVEAAQEAHAAYPNKRLIIHFMQPHIPFIGDVGQEIAGTGWSTDNTEESKKSVWSHLRSGNETIDIDTVWKAYNENLDIVLSHVTSLLRSVSGKTVISADHGNFVGEQPLPIPTKRMYGHPYGVYVPELVRVPWFIIESGERREIHSDPPVASESQSEETIEKRLQALGYK
jgi:hypothetical protein